MQLNRTFLWYSLVSCIGWFKFWVCRDEVVTYDYLSESYCPCGTIVYLKSGSNFRFCVKFQNVAIKFKFTEIETKNGSNFESG